jgi:hypothetical protein
MKFNEKPLIWEGSIPELLGNGSPIQPKLSVLNNTLQNPKFEDSKLKNGEKTGDKVKNTV